MKKGEGEKQKKLLKKASIINIGEKIKNFATLNREARLEE